MRWIDVKGVRVEWQGEPAGLNFITDITEAKKMEEDLIKVEKLESIGVLAVGRVPGRRRVPGDVRGGHEIGPAL